MPQKTPTEENEENLEEDDFWSEDSFAETMGPESEAKMRTFHMKHDEEMDYNCSSCNCKISAHNKDWHAGRCDKCFDKMLRKRA